MAVINSNKTYITSNTASCQTITTSANTSFSIQTAADSKQIATINKAVVFMLDYLTSEINNKENPTDKDTYILSVLMDLYAELMEYENHE